MPSRRNSIALTEQEQEAFLNDSWTLQVASNGHKGFPHLIAMWYVIIDGKIHFTTFGKSQKIMNLRRDPKITCMLESGKGYTELKGLVIEGNADVIDDDNAFTAKVMGHVGAKYNGIPIPTDTPEAALKAASKRVVVRVNPVDVYSWDHAKLGGRY
ncbi:MAG: pyridoxamine 5'-phosphate oxidase family protein [Dehalococcoidia bacterium]|jgi:nitroimidazol reductase NimA-like FMN-containing flavoprotein (pyridoxamine 5'-phosphate oxidase superfamily)